MFTTPFDTIGRPPPTRAELDELERRYDGPIPSWALDDLRRQPPRTLVDDLAAALHAVEGIEMNYRAAIRRLRQAQEYGASPATLRNAAEAVAEWDRHRLAATKAVEEVAAAPLLDAQAAE